MANNFSEIKHCHCADIGEVTRKINEFKSHGWNIHNFFIQVVPYNLEGVPDYTIIYDSKLDEDIHAKSRKGVRQVKAWLASLCFNDGVSHFNIN